VAVQTLYGFYTVSVGKTFLQGSGCDDFFSYIALEGCHQVVMLKVTSKDKDERKGKQKKPSVLFVRIENSLRTTLKIMRMEV